MRKLFFILFIFLCISTAYGQENTNVIIANDTTLYDLDAVDAALINKQKLHSPKRAFIYEALVPGLGHIYNKKYWHLPITYAAFGTAIYFLADNNDKYKKYRNAYEDFSHYLKYANQGPGFPLPISEPKSQRFREVLDVDYSKFSPNQYETFSRALKNNKDRFRRYRDLSYISIAAIYILNVIWATTDAHFFYYNVSDDLSLNMQPQLIVLQDYQRGLGFNFKINF